MRERGWFFGVGRVVAPEREACVPPPLPFFSPLHSPHAHLNGGINAPWRDDAHLVPPLGQLQGQAGYDVAQAARFRPGRNLGRDERQVEGAGRGGRRGGRDHHLGGQRARLARGRAGGQVQASVLGGGGRGEAGRRRDGGRRRFRGGRGRRGSSSSTTSSRGLGGDGGHGRLGGRGGGRGEEGLVRGGRRASGRGDWR